MNRRLIIPGLFAALLFTVSACGSDNDTSSDSGGHNKADVTFAQEMIPHHEQAVEMAKLATTRAQSAEVKQLASDIEAAQGPEIETMTGWLKGWGEDVPMAGMSHGDTMDMPGIMTTAQMNDLMAATGMQFDQMFLTMMVAHHQGAIEMAKDEQAHGSAGDAVALAKKIESAQAAEITMMQGMLAG
jgi:uncharacterized protein (DUF305 family)